MPLKDLALRVEAPLPLEKLVIERSGFAARCEAGLRPAVEALQILWALPLVRPLAHWAEPEPGGIAPGYI